MIPEVSLRLRREKVNGEWSSESSECWKPMASGLFSEGDHVTGKTLMEFTFRKGISSSSLRVKCHTTGKPTSHTTSQIFATLLVNADETILLGVLGEVAR